jgi:hypothetical protein
MVSGLGASVDVALMERLLRIVGVKLSRLLAQSPVELELYHEAHEVPAIVCGYVRLAPGPTDFHNNTGTNSYRAVDSLGNNADTAWSYVCHYLKWRVGKWSWLNLRYYGFVWRD